MIMSSLTPGVVARGQPARPPIQTKSFASTKMPCSRPSHSQPVARAAPARQQLSRGVELEHRRRRVRALAPRESTAGTCSTQMWSLRSTEIDVTSPSTQLLGIVGHSASSWNVGTLSVLAC